MFYSFHFIHSSASSFSSVALCRGAWGEMEEWKRRKEQKQQVGQGFDYGIRDHKEGCNSYYSHCSLNVWSLPSRRNLFEKIKIIFFLKSVHFNLLFVSSFFQNSLSQLWDFFNSLL